MRSPVRSLNLSATAAVAMYEAVRQIQPDIS
jgi:tRNA(Leu) C34 or U34 (ribose-2'-O)-methylase TrmL